MSAETALVFVHGSQIERIEDMPHGSLAVTLDTPAGRVAVLIDRRALHVIEHNSGRLRREAARALMPRAET